MGYPSPHQERDAAKVDDIRREIGSARTARLPSVCKRVTTWACLASPGEGDAFEDVWHWYQKVARTFQNDGTEAG